MNKIFTFLIVFMLFCSFSGLAQKLTVTGTITSADDQTTLPGVTILVKGTTNGTTTDIDGNYSLSGVNATDTLLFSFVGMVTQKIPVLGRTNINVILETESFGLDEVVVIGYGTVKKKDVTGAVSIVDSKVIDNLKPVKAEQALQGTVSGVNVTQQSGAPGAGLDIRIRGISTNGDPSPVVIIDGYIGDLNTINPDDIESMTVLKDAQAAIYGTVGANGIILITTKSGKKNTAAQVNFNSSFGLQETTRKLPVLNATEYAVLLNESYAANGQALPYPDVSGLGIGTDWQDELFETAPIYDNSLRVSGGSDKVVYTASASDLRQKGIIGGDKTGYNRTTGRISLGADMAKWLEFNTAVTYSYIDRKSINDFGLGSVLFNAVNMPATVPVYDGNGNYFPAPDNVGIEIINPLQQIADTYNDYNIGKLTGNAGLEANFAQHFTATARIGVNTSQSKYKSFNKQVYYGEGKVFNNNRSSVYQSKENFNDYTFDLFVTYDNTFKDAHHITGTIGNTIFKEWGNGLNATGFDVPYNSWEFADISLADGLSTTKATGSYTYDQRRLSYFGRVQYDFKGKYLLSAMLRRDASTKFGPDNAVAWFPSATLGWIISDENFMSSAKKINLLKMRMSYGILGSDKIGNYRYISTLSGEGVYIFSDSLVYGKAIGPLPNPSVKWEQSEQFDIGFDLKILDDKIDISADYFLKTTKDLLIPDIPVSGILGTSAPGSARPTINAGTVRNQGFEFAIGYRGMIKDDFVYRVNYNFTYLDNEVLEVNNGTGFFASGSFGVGQPVPARMEEGFPIGYFYGYETDGIFQTQAEVDAHPSQLALGAEANPGDIRYKDINGDGVINPDDRTNIGDPIPDFVMGLNIALEYKNFDFIAYFFASIGNDMVRNYERAQPNVNRMTYTLDRWTGPGTSDEVPRVTTAATSNNVFSDYYVEDGSYLRIQRVQLGYKLPQSALKKTGIKELRFYVAITNLFTFTKYMGFDPAASTGVPIGGGFDSGFYPAARTYTFGLNLNI
ncbi:MAG: TonB-dependent receptor [Bacteroidales bacterium]|nr:TonB-dependent receptor [Bacteroidales bacterium]